MPPWGPCYPIGTAWSATTCNPKPPWQPAIPRTGEARIATTCSMNPGKSTTRDHGSTDRCRRPALFHGALLPGASATPGPTLSTCPDTPTRRQSGSRSICTIASLPCARGLSLAHFSANPATLAVSATSAHSPIELNFQVNPLTAGRQSGFSPGHTIKTGWCAIEHREFTNDGCSCPPT